MFASFVLVSCAGNYATEFKLNYTFNEDERGWVTDFADLPANYDPAIYELDSGWSELPSGLGGNAPEGLVGIGGSSGESVYIKAVATTNVPEVIADTDSWLRVNIDKGNQASEGEDMINLGTLANPNIDLDTFTGEECTIMTLDSLRREFTVTTDGNVKRHARLNVISHLLSLIPYEDLTPEPVELPPRQESDTYQHRICLDTTVCPKGTHR